MAETFKPLPQNAVAFARYILGNSLSKLDPYRMMQRVSGNVVESKGQDIDLGELEERAKDVLRTAVENARKDGRSYVEYRDYPDMASGERPEDFWGYKRKERDFIGLYMESARDPVLEMFTSVGGFKFTDRDNGGFEIPNDPYDFDRSKSGNRRYSSMKDSYSFLTYVGQDMGGDYSFSLRGIIDPASSSADKPESVGISGFYFSNAIAGAYNSLRDQLFGEGDINPDKVPVEFTQFMRRGIEEHVAKNPTTSAFPLADVKLPDANANADFLEGSVVVPTEEGHVIANEELEFQIPIAPRERPVGRIPDVSFSVDAENPRVPAVIKSDQAVALSQRMVDSHYQNDDKLSFGKAFARNRAAGKEVFNWRGDPYTTKYKEEV
jgi:hypothetical protein